MSVFSNEETDSERYRHSSQITQLIRAEATDKLTSKDVQHQHLFQKAGPLLNAIVHPRNGAHSCGPLTGPTCEPRASSAWEPRPGSEAASQALPVYLTLLL